MDSETVRFTASDAAAIGRHAADKSLVSYSRFANACRVRLKRFITDHPEQQFMVYAVPLVLTGGALHDLRGAINFVIYSLKNDGFSVNYLGENLLYIAWKPKKGTHIDDYIARATVGSSAQPSGMIHGPGRAQPTKTNAMYRSFIDTEMQRRLQEYNGDDPNGRRLFSGATSHEEAMHNVMRGHTTL